MLNSDQKDIFREIGNIGAGHAATALSTLLGKPIEIEVPSAELESFTTIIDRVGGAEAYTAGALLRFSGDIRATLLFLMPLHDAEKLIGQLMKSEFQFFSDSHEMGVSAWEEIGNILIGAYARSISDWLDLSLQVSVPASAFDMVGALLEVALLESSTPGNMALYIDTHLSSAGNELTGHLLLLPEANAFQTVFQRLGVDIDG
ncbi:chemotaxis protein CheC [Exiguobacterium sp. Leaf187]|jgi:chemotaxis protein CheC|uniref:Chemotaxis protein CheC n=1 Tax=Exiguobacterium indicum TaxID=296995 RepID=A0A0V8GK61_9BACL|nr:MULTISPECIES: chemotaxis protein CheC [Exiguobacterium]AHA30085.1 chemotaxis protein CheC [Exiguobacterium sp. MH3]KQS19328.1 chemotaxis protein CheC [Exiguobacterium sp. Leaf187]KSU50660.1 chemotaxis protein CheC [Exiguobacterium enclense]KTR26506.1 chemotaxis protein CheC [Exiguobacterium indicum]MCQ4089908.1 chemotaxis protein CheC [Exiguobacterium sp. LL15]